MVARVPAYGTAGGQHVAAADAELGQRRPGDQCRAEPAVQGGRELEAGLGGVLPGDVVDRCLGRYDEVEGAIQDGVDRLAKRRSFPVFG